MSLHLVPPSPPPEEPRKARRQRLARLSKDAGMLTCHRCAGIEVMETKVGVRVVAGKLRGGTKHDLRYLLAQGRARRAGLICWLERG